MFLNTFICWGMIVGLSVPRYSAGHFNLFFHYIILLAVIRDAQTGIHAGDCKSDSTEDGKRNYVTLGLMSAIIQM